MARSFSKFPSAHPGPVPQPGPRLTPRRKQRKLPALRQLLFYQEEAVSRPLPWLSALSRMFFPPYIHKANSLAAVKFHSDDTFSMRPPRLLWQPCY